MIVSARPMPMPEDRERHGDRHHGRVARERGHRVAARRQHEAQRGPGCAPGCARRGAPRRSRPTIVAIEPGTSDQRGLQRGQPQHELEQLRAEEEEARQRHEAEQRSPTRAPLKTRLRNRVRSIIGVALRCWRRTNTTSRRRGRGPAAASVVSSRPAVAPCLIGEDQRHHRDERQRDRDAGSNGPGARVARLGDEGERRRHEDDDQRHVDAGTPSPTRSARAGSRPRRGRATAPPENMAAHAAMAVRRSRASSKMLRISDSVEGMRVAPKKPSSARPAMSISGLGAEGRQRRRRAESDGAGHEQAATADAVAEAAHGDEQAGQHQRVDVDDPQQLVAARTQLAADLGQRERQHGVVDRDEQHGQHQHGQRGPFASAGTVRHGG